MGNEEDLNQGADEGGGQGVQKLARLIGQHKKQREECRTKS